MKNSEKILLAILLLIVNAGIGLYATLPSFTAIQQKGTTIKQKEGEVALMKTNISTLNMEVSRYQKMKDLPENIVVRQFQPDTYEQQIKIMVDQVLGVASDTGNELIELKPWQAPPIMAQAAPATSNPQAAPATNSPNNGTAAPPPNDPATELGLRNYGYEIVLRGAYSNINDFLKLMNNHQELIEVHSIKIENESGPSRPQQEGSTNPLINPFKPIKLTAKLVLFLQNAINVPQISVSTTLPEVTSSNP